jgi:hypothetical protein
MFTRSIALIVGAGASFEYDMPLGLKLAADIAENLKFRFEHYQPTPISGDPELFNILFRKFHQDRDTLNRYTRAGNDLSAAISSSVSIDDAMYQLSENPEAITLGKLGIIRGILKAESQSTLRYSRETGRLDEAAGRDGWIEQLFSMAISGLRRAQIHTAFDNITFINFNYDRCIEHYLFWSLQRIGIEQAEAEQVVSNLKMIRPYGGLGTSLPNARGGIPFGYNGTTDPFAMMDRIRTYTESAIHDGELLGDILHRAELVLFLGFGFHAQNLKLLQLDHPRSPYVMATVKKIHPANLDDLRLALHRTLRLPPEPIELYDMTAPELLRELRLKIAMRAST